MRYSICFLLLLSFATTSLADPRVWGPEGRPIRNEFSFSSGRTMATNSDGQTLMVWTDYQTAEGDLYAQLLDNSGNSLWGDSARLLFTTESGQWDVQAVSVSNGYILLWEDFRGSGIALYAIKLDLSGNVVWTQNGGTGVRIDNGQFSEAQADRIFVLPDDGILITYLGWDYFHENFSYFILRISANGDAVWDDPVIVTDASLGEFVNVDADRMGNLYVVRGGGWQTSFIYLRKLSIDGDWVWGWNTISNGDSVSHATATVLGDESGGCYLAWKGEWSTSSTRLLSQRYDSNGFTLWDTPRTIDESWEANYGISRVVANLEDEVENGVLIVWSEEIADNDRRYYAQKVCTAPHFWDSGSSKDIG